LSEAVFVSEGAAFKNWTISGVRLEGHGVFHAKMTIIVTRTGVRVCVHTGNFIDCDWFNATNATFVQDFALKQEGVSPGTSDFGNELESFLLAIRSNAPSASAAAAAINTAKKSLMNRLRYYDFSSAEVKIVSSIPGKYTRTSPAEAKKTALWRLQHLLEREDLPSGFERSEGRLAIQISSLSNMGGRESNALRNITSALWSSRSGSTFNASRPWERLQIIWPDEVAVRYSNLGWSAGNSLPCNAKNIYADEAQGRMYDSFRQTLCLWESSEIRPHSCPHIKTYTVYKTDERGTHQLAWCLLTSSNLSQAAWGQIQHGAQLAVSSFEIGVLYLPSQCRTTRRRFSLTPFHRLLGLDLEDEPVAASSSSSSSSSSASSSSSSSSTTANSPSSHSSPSVRFLVSAHQRDDDVHALYFPMPFKLDSSPYSSETRPWTWDTAKQEKDNFGQEYSLQGKHS